MGFLKKVKKKIRNTASKVAKKLPKPIQKAANFTVDNLQWKSNLVKAVKGNKNAKKRILRTASASAAVFAAPAVASTVSSLSVPVVKSSKVLTNSENMGLLGNLKSSVLPVVQSTIGEKGSDKRKNLFSVLGSALGSGVDKAKEVGLIKETETPPENKEFMTSYLGEQKSVQSAGVGIVSFVVLLFLFLGSLSIFGNKNNKKRR